MEQYFRFSDYDLFGFLASGLAALAACDLIGGTTFLIGASWGASETTSVVLGAYVLGHVVAAFSSGVIERWLADRGLGHPVDHLLGRTLPSLPWVVRLVVGGYQTPLAKTMRTRLTAVSDDVGEELFQHAFSVAKRDQFAIGRLSSFLTMYGFSRNFAFIAMVVAIGLPVQALLKTRACTNILDVPCWSVAIAAALLALVMFNRYLKYRRLYVKEVLLSYLAASGQEASR